MKKKQTTPDIVTTYAKRGLIAAILIIMGAALTISIFSSTKNNSQLQDMEAYYREAAVQNTGLSDLTAHSLPPVNGREGLYFTTGTGETLLFSSYFAPHVTGYGGPMELLIYLDTEKKIKEIIFLEHKETPQWINKIQGWLGDLKGRSLAELEPLADVDTLSGATFTTTAVLKILRKTGEAFAGLKTGSTAKQTPQGSGFSVTKSFFILTAFLLIALALRNVPAKRVRLIFMAFTVAICGFYLNMQFSTYHILTAAEGGIFLNGLDKNLFYFVILPLTVLLLGNIYCGYLCPFGLLQELVHEAFFFVSINIFEKASFLKLIRYIFLLLIVLSALVGVLGPVTKLDILPYAFDVSLQITFFAAIAFLVLSAFVNRFWCRYLCPTGAFLSILHGASYKIYKAAYKLFPVVKKFYHIPHIKKCDLGVKSTSDMSCLCCDRCRYGVKTPLYGDLKKLIGARVSKESE